MSGLFESSQEASVAAVREEVKEAMWGRDACRPLSREPGEGSELRSDRV